MRMIMAAPERRARRLRGAPGVAGLALLGLLAATPARGDGIDSEGMAPWEICALCHGLHGASPRARFPKLAGQKPDYIVKQLRDIRDGRRDNDGGQMQAIVTEVADEDFAAVAEWFASQPPPEPSEVEGDVALGAGLYAERGCADCHGARAPEELTPPYLAAQHEAYLVKQLTDFREGRRENDPEGVMRDQASRLSDAEIAAIAAYLAAAPRN